MEFWCSVMGDIFVWQSSLSSYCKCTHTHMHTHTHMLTHMLTHPHAHTHTCTQPVEDVAQHIEKGYRMDAPDGSPDAIHRIMQECWNKDPSQRPNFTRIERQLDTIAIS